MSSIEALHTAARRYCEDRAAWWSARYDDLRRSESAERERRGIPEPATYTYSDEALGTSPRYQILYAIQVAVEMFTAADFDSLDQARALLAAAGESAESIFTRPPKEGAERLAIDEERLLFMQYVRQVSLEELAHVDPLPYRRTLTSEESQLLRQSLKPRWGVENFYWFPLDRPDDVPPPEDAVALDAEPFFDPDVQARLRAVLETLGVARLWELREFDTDADCEIDLGLFVPTYTGAEGFWTDRTLGWLVYASHESSVTAAGAHLLPTFREAFPEWEEWIYAPDW